MVLDADDRLSVGMSVLAVQKVNLSHIPTPALVVGVSAEVSESGGHEGIPLSQCDCGGGAECRGHAVVSVRWEGTAFQADLCPLAVTKADKKGQKRERTTTRFFLDSIGLKF